MPRNIEIKAKVKDWEATNRAAAAAADKPPKVLQQEDVFYTTNRGRLKLRTENGASTLIYYQRPDQPGPKQSEYFLLPITDLQAARKLLDAAHGTRGVIRKKRWLYMSGQTRIHLDQVENLGNFLELEVVLADDQTPADGEKIAHRLMAALGIGPDQLIDRAYMDLLNFNRDSKADG